MLITIQNLKQRILNVRNSACLTSQLSAFTGAAQTGGSLARLAHSAAFCALNTDLVEYHRTNQLQIKRPRINRGSNGHRSGHQRRHLTWVHVTSVCLQRSNAFLKQFKDCTTLQILYTSPYLSTSPPFIPSRKRLFKKKANRIHTSFHSSQTKFNQH